MKPPYLLAIVLAAAALAAIAPIHAQRTVTKGNGTNALTENLTVSGNVTLTGDNIRPSRLWDAVNNVALVTANDSEIVFTDDLTVVGFQGASAAVFRNSLGLTSAATGNATGLTSGAVSDDRLSSNVMTLTGNHTITGNKTFTQDLTVADITTSTPAQDGILNIEVLDDAAAIVADGGGIELPDGNQVWLVFDDPHYRWSDNDYVANQGSGDPLAGATPADVAVGLGDWLTAYSGGYLSPSPNIELDGANVVITYEATAVAEGWAESGAGGFFHVSETQSGNGAGLIGTSRAVRLYNEDNGKLYRLKITGTPNPVITLQEVTE